MNIPTIRVATKNDVSGILDLYHQLALGQATTDNDYLSNPEKYQQAFTQIEKFPGQQLLVAEEQGKIVGTLVMLIVPNLSHGALPWAIIENMVVAESYHRKGVGKLLIEYAEAEAKEAGCYKVQLLSDNRRQWAHAFYRAMGFKASAKGFRLYL